MSPSSSPATGTVSCAAMWYDVRARRRYEGLRAKAAGTSYPHEAEACYAKADAMREKVRSLTPDRCQRHGRDVTPPPLALPGRHQRICESPRGGRGGSRFYGQRGFERASTVGSPPRRCGS